MRRTNTVAELTAELERAAKALREGDVVFAIATSEELADFFDEECNCERCLIEREEEGGE